MKIYIAGAITSDPDYKQKFKSAEKDLRFRGHDVVSPIYHSGPKYKDYLIQGLAALSGCDAVYLLSDYAASPGAQLELRLATLLGIRVLYESPQTADPVNHPQHYNIPGRKECIAEMLDVYGAEKVKAFCELNAYKYRYRHTLKGGEEDLKKAAWYDKKKEEL